MVGAGVLTEVASCGLCRPAEGVKWPRGGGGGHDNTPQAITPGCLPAFITALSTPAQAGA